MKRMLMVLVLGMALTSAFGCDSPFKKVEGITCELQYVLCKDIDADITLCDGIKEKVEQYEEEYSEARVQLKEISRQLKEVEKELEEVRDDLDGDRFFFLLNEQGRLQEKLYDAVTARTAISDEFLGEDALNLMMSEDFYNEALKVVENI